MELHTTREGLPQCHGAKESSCSAGDMGSLDRKIPWRRAWQHTPLFLPGESHGQRSLLGHSPWACRVWCDFVTEDLRTTRELLSEPPPISQWWRQSLSPEGHSTVREKDKRANYFIYIYPLSKKPQTQWTKHQRCLLTGTILPVCGWLSPTRPPGPWGSGWSSRVTTRRARCPFIGFLCLTTYAWHCLVSGLSKFSSSTFDTFQEPRTVLKYTMNEFKLTVTRWGGFPGGASGKEPARQCRRRKRLGFDPWVGKIP